MWTGVVPVWQTLGKPIPAEANVVALPEHVKELVEGCNRQNVKEAMEAAQEKKKD